MSMLIGAFGALVQNSVKRILAYSLDLEVRCRRLSAASCLR